MFNTLKQWWGKQTDKNKKAKKNTKSKNKRKSAIALKCMNQTEAPDTDIEAQQQLIPKVEKRMLTDEKGPPIFLLHIKNYQLVYYVIMLFFTMNLRMSYYFTRPIFWRWSLPVVLFSGYVFFRWRWRSNLVWFCIHLIMFIQNLYDLATDHSYYLPHWFVIYPTAVLIVCSSLENILFVLSNDEELDKHIKFIKQRSSTVNLDTIDNYSQLREKQKTDRLLRIKLSLMNLFVDKDVRDFYPIGFELYMMICALFLPISGGGLAFRNCTTDLYGLMLWIMFVILEDMKTRAHKKMFKLPSHIVKVIYLLYIPPMFWINIHLLVIMNILVIPEFSKLDKFALMWMMAFCDTLLYQNIHMLDSCFLISYY